MMRASGVQQRSSERINVELPVEFKTQQRFIEARIANIGAGGMCIRTADILPVRSHSFFRIVSQDNTLNFNVEAEVMWAQPQSRIRQRRNKRPGLMGVRFIKSRFLTEETIDSLLRQAHQLSMQVAS